MPDEKISAFSLDSGALTGAEEVTGLKAGANENFSVQAIADFAIKTVKVSLSSAEILALNTTPKTLVPAPGSGKIIRPLSYFFNMTFGGNPYATNTQLISRIGSVGTFVTNTTSLPAGTDHVSFMIPITAVLNGADDYTNAPLTLSTNSGNPTAGDGTLNVYVTYIVVTK